MKSAYYASLLALAIGACIPVAQAAEPAASPKPIVKTSCQDYLAMDETIKPKFIYMAVGHSKKGQPEVVFDMTATDKLQPEIDQYCRVNLTKSAYEHVMKSSMASEKVNK